MSRELRNETFTTKQPDGSVITTTTRVRSKYVEEDVEGLGCGMGTLNERYCCRPVVGLVIVSLITSVFGPGPFKGVLFGQTFLMIFDGIAFCLTFIFLVVFFFNLHKTHLFFWPWKVSDFIFSVVSCVIFLIMGFVEAYYATGAWSNNCNDIGGDGVIHNGCRLIYEWAFASISTMTFNTGKVNATDAKQLGEFNSYLSTQAYLNGFTPSNEDNVAFNSFTTAPNAKFPHVLRWYNHISSFTNNERSGWSKQSASGESAQGTADDDFDLFGEESEDDAEKERITQERLKAYAEKKAKKPGPIAKSNIIYDVKPWDDTVDPLDIEKKVREISTDGLVWGSSKIVPVAFGIMKLQICCVIEDDKVSTDWLEEKITENEDLVQSVDVVAFNKV